MALHQIYLFIVQIVIVFQESKIYKIDKSCDTVTRQLAEAYFIKIPAKSAPENLRYHLYE